MLQLSLLISQFFYHILKTLLPSYLRTRNVCSQLHCSNSQAKISLQNELQHWLKSIQRTELWSQTISLPTLTPTLLPRWQCSPDWKDSWQQQYLKLLKKNLSGPAVSSIQTLFVVLLEVCLVCYWLFLLRTFFYFLTQQKQSHSMTLE